MLQKDNITLKKEITKLNQFKTAQELLNTHIDVKLSAEDVIDDATNQAKENENNKISEDRHCPDHHSKPETNYEYIYHTKHKI